MTPWIFIANNWAWLKCIAMKMKVGDYISINGYKGSVYKGEMKVNLI